MVKAEIISSTSPRIYSASPPLPLLFNFHGGGGDMASQVAISDLRAIADTAGFIAVYPQALPDPNDGGSTNWLHKDPTQVDDVLFIDALIDSLKTNGALIPTESTPVVIRSGVNSPMNWPVG